MQRDESPAATGSERASYRAYMLRCWAEPQGAEVVWRFSLEAISGPTRHGFADLPSLLRFLKGELDDQSNTDRTSDPR